jgi:glycerophosphoryl diester phosphodiesterase
MQKNNPLRRAAAVLAVCFALLPPLASAECHGMVLHAHRGSHEAPENSMAAVKQAFTGEWDGAEIDIQQLRDQHWVLHHDPKLGRTTSLQGRSAGEINSNAWKEIRLKDRKGRISGETAPFLFEVLTQLPEDDNKVLNVEIKQLNNNCEAAQHAAQILNEGLPSGRWFLTAIDRSQLQCVRRVDKRGYVGQIVLDPNALAKQSRYSRFSGNIPPKIIDTAWLKKLKQEVGEPVGVHVDAATLKANPTLLADAKLLGVPVFTYSLGSERDHAEALRTTARRTGLLPSGAIIDGAAGAFCDMIGNL